MLILTMYKAQVGSAGILPAWKLGGLRPIAGWKPALPGSRALNNPLILT